MKTLDKCTDCNVKIVEGINKTARYNRCMDCEKERYRSVGIRKKKKLVADFIKNPNIRQVEGYQGRYMVSNTGDVYSVTEFYIRKIRPGVNASGYYLVCLFDRGKKSMQGVHRLVAKAFIENKSPYQKKIINHIDGNKLNNNVENLEWTSFKGNTQHALRTGLQPKGEQIASAKLNDEKVLFIYKNKRRNGDKRKKRLTQKQLAEMFGVSPRIVHLIQNKLLWRHVFRKDYKAEMVNKPFDKSENKD